MLIHHGMNISAPSHNTMSKNGLMWSTGIKVDGQSYGEHKSNITVKWTYFKNIFTDLYKQIIARL